MAERVLDPGSEEEFDRYLRLACEGALTEEDRDRFEFLLREHPGMKRRYAEYIGLHAELTWRYRVPADIVLAEHVPSTLVRRGIDYLLQNKQWLNGAAVLATGAAVLLAVWLRRADEPAGHRPQSPTEMRAGKNLAPAEWKGKPEADAIYVARIVKASTDCRWGEMTSPVEFLVRVRAGDHLHIAAGLVEMEFFSGARIILHGPAVFTPTGIASGHLESGRLTGEVANGNFRLMTPAAEVIDLGTSFGVAADAAVGTDVVVFDGRVQVVSRAEGRGSEPLDMTEGMAARFRVDGSTQYGLHTDAESFRRTVAPGSHSASENTLSLVDVIAGGDGTGKRLAGAIDPLTGNKDFAQRRRRQPRRNAARYLPTPWNSMIDGVFIPASLGVQTQLDSSGNAYDLPAQTGRSWGPVWSRSKESLLEMGSDINGDFWGDNTLQGILEVLKKTENGLLGIHPNVGVTFDLRAMQLVHRRVPKLFRTSVLNIENSQDYPELHASDNLLTANFYVFVDGKPRHERISFSRKDGAQNVTVALSADDRFLTLVSTDDGDMAFDHVVLVDPIISLQSSINNKAVEPIK